MLLKVVVFLLSIFCLSCERAEVSPEKMFALELKEVMTSAQKFDTPLFSPFDVGELKDPVGTWLLTLVIDSKYCLFYRTPLEDSSGILRLTRSPSEGCREAFTQDVIVQLDKVNNLNFIELNHRERQFGPRQEWDIAGEYQGVSFRWEIFAPLATKERGRAPKKLSSFSGRTIELNPASFGEQKGSYQKRYSDGEALFCHQVDEDCQNVHEFNCESCRYGWYEVVDYSCPQGGSKICGPSRCGQRGEPACPRGLAHIQKKRSEIIVCEKGSKAGFCEEGLDTHCDENNVLICL